MFTVVLIITFIAWAVIPGENSTPLHFASIESSLILSIWQSESTLALEQIVFEIAIVNNAVRKLINSLSMFWAVQKLTFVKCAIFPFLLSLAIGQITQPLARIGIIFSLIDQRPSALSYVVSNLSFIVTASAENEATLAVCETIGERSRIVASIFEYELALPMRFLILPFSTVHRTWRLDEMRRPLLPAQFFAASWLELLQISEFLLDIGADLEWLWRLNIFRWAWGSNISLWSPGSSSRCGSGDSNGFSAVVVGEAWIICVVLTACSLSHFLLYYYKSVSSKLNQISQHQYQSKKCDIKSTVKFI